MLRVDVMHIDMTRSAAARHGAALAIAQHHEPTNFWRDVLCGGARLLIRSDGLSVALGNLAIGLGDRQVPATAVLPSLLAPGAHRRQNLIARAPAIVGAGIAVEDRVAQRHDERIVIELGAVLV